MSRLLRRSISSWWATATSAVSGRNSMASPPPLPPKHTNADSMLRIALFGETRNEAVAALVTRFLNHKQQFAAKRRYEFCLTGDLYAETGQGKGAADDTTRWCSDAQAAILVYDATSLASLQTACDWLCRIRQLSECMSVIIVGTTTSTTVASPCVTSWTRTNFDSSSTPIQKRHQLKTTHLLVGAAEAYSIQKEEAEWEDDPQISSLIQTLL